MALALMFVLSACAVSRGETVVKIGVVAGRMSDAETAAFCEMLETFFASQETKDVKYELFIADAAGSTERQKEYIINLLGQKLNLLVTNYMDSSTVNETAEKLIETGTPVLIFGRQMIVRDGIEYAAHSSVEELLDQVKGCYVSGDLHQASLLQGEILAARPRHGDVNGDGVIQYVIIRDSAPRAESRLRTDMFLRAVGNAGLEAVCLGDRNGAATKEQAKTIFERLFRDFGTQIEAVICTHDYIAAGVAQVLQEASDAKALQEAEAAKALREAEAAKALQEAEAAQELQDADGAADETAEEPEEEAEAVAAEEPEEEAEAVAEEEPQAVQTENVNVYADICVLGMDGTEEALQLVREGKITGTVLIDDAAQYRKAQEAIMKILNGEEIEKYYWAEYTIVNGAYMMNLDRQNAR